MNQIIALLALINSYRAEYSLPPVSLDSSLNRVALAHAVDFVEKVKTGNGHMWSDGCWGVCATERAMVYGYPEPAAEIAHYHYPDPSIWTCTPECAFNDWKKSKHHNDAILNKCAGCENMWRSVGIAIYKGFACVWFGEK